jgi:hypothetical protein
MAIKRTHVLSPADQLDGESVLPGFTCAAQDLFCF